MSDSLWPYGLQYAGLPCPSPTPAAYSSSCPSSWWCHPTISSSVIPFSSHLQSFPASGCFPMSHFCTSGGQSIGVSPSASVLPMNIQDWLPLGWTGWISLKSKGLSRVFSNTIILSAAQIIFLDFNLDHVILKKCLTFLKEKIKVLRLANRPCEGCPSLSRYLSNLQWASSSSYFSVLISTRIDA